MENLTPPANVQNRPGWSTASASRDAGTPPAGTAPALTMPTGTASRSAPPPAPGRTPPEPLPPVQTKGQSSSAPRAAALAFSFAPPSRLPGLPDQQPGARWVLSAAAPGKSWKVPGERWTQYPDITPTTCTGKDQHRQRRTDDPAAHKLHSLHTLPDLTAASSPPPAPTDTAPRQPCRPPAAADHPANSQKPPTAARRRRGQILHLTG